MQIITAFFVCAEGAKNNVTMNGNDGVTTDGEAIHHRLTANVDDKFK